MPTFTTPSPFSLLSDSIPEPTVSFQPKASPLKTVKLSSLEQQKRHQNKQSKPKRPSPLRTTTMSELAAPVPSDESATSSSSSTASSVDNEEGGVAVPPNLQHRDIASFRYEEPQHAAEYDRDGDEAGPSDRFRISNPESWRLGKSRGGKWTSREVEKIKAKIRKGGKSGVKGQNVNK